MPNARMKPWDQNVSMTDEMAPRQHTKAQADPIESSHQRSSPSPNVPASKTKTVELHNKFDALLSIGEAEIFTAVIKNCRHSRLYLRWL